MEVKTFKALEEAVKDYKYINLCNSDGAQLVNYNNATTKKNTRLEHIKKRLESPALPDGIYIIKAKDTIKGQTADEIIFIKGKGDAPAPVATPQGPGTKNLKECNEGPAVLTYAEAVRLNTEIANLTYQVRTLENENALLTKDLSDAEIEIKELEAAAAAKLSEGTPAGPLATLGETLKTLLPSITALFDTNFQLKQRELDIKEKQLQRPPAVPVTPQPPQAPGFEAPANTFILDDSEQLILNYFDLLKNTNPDTYKQVFDNMQAEQSQAETGGNE